MNIGVECLNVIKEHVLDLWIHVLCLMLAMQVASRRVVAISAVIMIAASLFGKWMAVLIMIPEPVIGGVFIVLCGELSLSVAMLCASVIVFGWLVG